MLENRRCASCGAELPSDAPSDICVPCRSRINLDSMPVSLTGREGAVMEGASPVRGDIADGPRPRLVGDYEIVGNGKKGGMGIVYGARHRHTHAQVALKLIRSVQAPSPVKVERFLTEARAVACL